MPLNCYKCQHRRNVPGNAHISCAKPCAEVTGDPHGIRKGWFMYPILFDPIWGEGCKNFSALAVSPAVSDSVSPETI